MAKVFVGIPTWNRPEFVREAIRSVLSQTETDLRVVVSDNASEKPAAESVARFVAECNDPRISYHLQPRNAGEYGQGRFFFSQCTEEYFTILHDDDLFEPGYVEAALSHMENDRRLACFLANPYIFDDRGLTSQEQTARYLAQHGRNRYGEGVNDILEPLLRCGFLPISGTLFRTSALRDSGFVDEDFHGGYPFELNVLLRLGERNGLVYFTKQQLLGFRFHAGAGRRKNLRYNEHIMGTIVRLLERRRFTGTSERLRKKMLAFTCRHFGMIRLAHGETSACYRYLLRALRLNPLSYRNWLYPAVTLPLPFLVRPFIRARVFPGQG